MYVKPLTEPWSKRTWTRKCSPKPPVLLRPPSVSSRSMCQIWARGCSGWW